MPLFDRPPVTRVRPNDPRTQRFLEIIAAWSAWKTSETPGYFGLEGTFVSDALSAVVAYGTGNWSEASRRLVSMSNIVARHRHATTLISFWGEMWSASNDADITAGAIQRFRSASTNHSHALEGQIRVEEDRPTDLADSVSALNTYLALPDVVRGGIAVIIWRSWLGGPPERGGRLLIALARGTAVTTAEKATADAVGVETGRLRVLRRQLVSTRTFPTALAGLDTLLTGSTEESPPSYLIGAIDLARSDIDNAIAQRSWLRGALAERAGRELRALASFLADHEFAADGSHRMLDDQELGWQPVQEMLEYRNWQPIVRHFLEMTDTAFKP